MTRGSVSATAQCRLMGWSGRAPAPPAIEAGKGRQRRGARHAREAQHHRRRSRHRYRQELVPRRRSRSRGAIVLRQKWSRGQVESRFANMSHCLIAHHADQETGEGKVTYTAPADATGLSRTMVSRALNLLVQWGLLVRHFDRRSGYALTGWTKCWGKLPARPMYAGKAIAAFQHFHLRSMIELNALKMFLLVVQRRDDKDNLAHVTYKQISNPPGSRRDKSRRPYPCSPCISSSSSSDSE